MFWIISAILIVVSLAFLLPALAKSDNSGDATREQNIAIAREKLAELEASLEKGDIDKASFQANKDEIEVSLYNDLGDTKHSSIKNNNQSKLSQWLVLSLIPLIAIPVYLSLGNLNFTKSVDPKVGAIESSKSTMPLKKDGTPYIEKIVKNLQAEMNANPTDPKGWYMLGRSYMLLQDFPSATQSFEKALALRPESAENMLSLADALSMTKKGILEGRPRVLVDKALSMMPNNVTALWLSGMAASQEGEYIEAITKWQNLLGLIQNKPKDVEAVQGLITEAKSRLNADQVNAVETKQKQKGESDAKKSVRVTIELSPQFKDKASPEDSVFIYAKASSGPPMPLVAVRKQVKDLPMTIILNDQMAMMPSLKLSSFPVVSVGARISKSGEALPQAGDLFDEKQNIVLGGEVNLTINQVLEK